MNIWRNQYASGSNGWFETYDAALGDANAQDNPDNPKTFKQRVRVIRIKSKSDLVNLLRDLETDK